MLYTSENETIVILLANCVLSLTSLTHDVNLLITTFILIGKVQEQATLALKH